MYFFCRESRNALGGRITLLEFALMCERRVVNGYLEYFYVLQHSFYIVSLPWANNGSVLFSQGSVALHVQGSLHAMVMC